MRLTGRVLPTFPAGVVAGAGIDIDKTNGVYTISLDPVAPLAWPQRVHSAAGDATVLVTDGILLINKTVGAATNVNLGLASARAGGIIAIIDDKLDADVNPITPVLSGGETINGLTGPDWVISSKGGALILLPRAAGGWRVLNFG